MLISRKNTSIVLVIAFAIALISIFYFILHIYIEINILGCGFAKYKSRVYDIVELIPDDAYLHGDDFINGPHYYYSSEEIERGYKILGVIKSAHSDTFEIMHESDYSCYAKDKERIYFHGAGPTNELLGVNMSTFEILESYHINDDYAKDDKNVYHNGKLLEGVDGASFVRFKPSSGDIVRQFKDKQNVYTISSFGEKDLIVGVDVKTYEMVDMSNQYGKDKYKVFLKGYEILGANPETFAILPGSYNFSKDDSNIFFGTSIFAEADSDTFRIFPGGYPLMAADNEHVYSEKGVLAGINPSEVLLCRNLIKYEDEFLDGYGNVVIISDYEKEKEDLTCRPLR